MMAQHSINIGSVHYVDLIETACIERKNQKTNTKKSADTESVISLLQARRRQ